MRLALATSFEIASANTILICVRCHGGLAGATCLHCPDCCRCMFCERCDTAFEPDDGGCGECSRCVQCGCVCNTPLAPSLVTNPFLRSGRRDQRQRAAQLARNQGAKLKEVMKEFKARTSIPTIVEDEEGSRLENEVGVVFHSSGRKEFKLNPLRRFLSVELEIAELGEEWMRCSPLEFSMPTFAINEKVEEWGAGLINDISLPRRGFEINTAPANGDRFIRQIEEMGEVLHRFDASCTNTREPDKRVQPCGLHVHVDARDFRYYDLRRFLLFYEHVEPALFGMLPGYRRGSHYAIACGRQYADMVRAGKPLKPKDREQFIKKNRVSPEKYHLLREVYHQMTPKRGDKRACPQEARYRALNLHQWFYRGTMEFRHMYGTMNVEEIISWALLMGSLLDYSMKMPEREIAELVKKRVNSPVALLQIAACTPSVAKFVENQTERFKGDSDFTESPMLGREVGRRSPAPPVAYRVEPNEGTFENRVRNISRTTSTPLTWSEVSVAASSLGLIANQQARTVINDIAELDAAIASFEEDENDN